MSFIHTGPPAKRPCLPEFKKSDTGRLSKYLLITNLMIYINFASI